MREVLVGCMGDYRRWFPLAVPRRLGVGELRPTRSHSESSWPRHCRRARKTRVRIAAPLPEPIIMGKERKRDDSISGILLYDALGNERGGYVTDNSVGNAFLTLDSAIGQEVTLVAYPKGGAEFGMNDDEKNKVVMSALKSGPRFRLIRGATAVVDLPSSPSKTSDQ